MKKILFLLLLVITLGACESDTELGFVYNYC